MSLWQRRPPEASTRRSGFTALGLWLLCTPSLAQPHTVEELTFRVARADQSEFLKQDAAIWTPVLAAQAGYLGKETWLASDPPDEIKLVIRWRTRRDWDAVPKPLLAQTDARFKSALGDADWSLIRVRAFRSHDPADTEPGVSIDSLLNREALLSATEVGVAKDPVYFRPKRYLAVPIREAIERLVPKGTDPASLEVVFDCTDGYHSRMSLEDVLTGEPWLAFRDLDAPDGRVWFKNPKGPPPRKMGRAYVVWRNADNPAELTWPYAVERIGVVRRSVD